jgi:cystathionine beta-synthase
MHKVYDNILETIGDTPLVRLNKVIGSDFPCPVYAKIEYGNPGNSIKDRMALKMIEVAEQDGRLKLIERICDSEYFSLKTHC